VNSWRKSVRAWRRWSQKSVTIVFRFLDVRSIETRAMVTYSPGRLRIIQFGVHAAVPSQVAPFFDIELDGVDRACRHVVEVAFRADTIAEFGEAGVVADDHQMSAIAAEFVDDLQYHFGIRQIQTFVLFQCAGGQM